ncbi:unnamed protein product [Diatraea saccharalis]|uniref:Uncharacterized protein n=1 Tax=Diatraea saccharalis TaxID=40085 RepID=A0A9P0G0N8_9NEOP|nr:unnamed protein product [Diatraea saccharalis]
MEIRYPLSRLGKRKFKDEETDDTKPLIFGYSHDEIQNQSSEDRKDNISLQIIQNCKENIMNDLDSLKKKEDSDSDGRAKKSRIKIMFEDGSSSDELDVHETKQSTENSKVDVKLLMQTRVLLTRIPASQLALYQLKSAQSEPKEIPSMKNIRLPNDQQKGTTRYMEWRGGERVLPVAQVAPHTHTPPEKDGVCTRQQLADRIRAEVKRRTDLSRTESTCCVARDCMNHVEIFSPYSVNSATLPTPLTMHKAQHKLSCDCCCLWLIRDNPCTPAALLQAKNVVRRTLIDLTMKPESKDNGKDKVINNSLKEIADLPSDDDFDTLVIDEGELPQQKSSKNKSAKCADIEKKPQSKRNKCSIKQPSRPYTRKKKKRPPSNSNEDDAKCSSGDVDYDEWMRQRNKCIKYFTINPITVTKKGVSTSPHRFKNTNGAQKKKKVCVKKTVSMRQDSSAALAKDPTKRTTNPQIASEGTSNPISVKVNLKKKETRDEIRMIFFHETQSDDTKKSKDDTETPPTLNVKEKTEIESGVSASPRRQSTNEAQKNKKVYVKKTVLMRQEGAEEKIMKCKKDPMAVLAKDPTKRRRNPQIASKGTSNPINVNINLKTKETRDGNHKIFFYQAQPDEESDHDTETPLTLNVKEKSEIKRANGVEAEISAGSLEHDPDVIVKRERDKFPLSLDDSSSEIWIELDSAPISGPRGTVTADLKHDPDVSTCKIPPVLSKFNARRKMAPHIEHTPPDVLRAIMNTNKKPSIQSHVLDD